MQCMMALLLCHVSFWRHCNVYMIQICKLPISIPKLTAELSKAYILQQHEGIAVLCKPCSNDLFEPQRGERIVRSASLNSAVRAGISGANAKLIYQKYTEGNDCLEGKTWPVYFWLDRATCSLYIVGCIGKVNGGPKQVRALRMIRITAFGKI